MHRRADEPAPGRPGHLLAPGTLTSASSLAADPRARSGLARKVVGQTGILTGRRRRAVDSTILADAVATQDTVTQLVSAIRRVGWEVPGADLDEDAAAALALLAGRRAGRRKMLPLDRPRFVDIIDIVRW